MSRRRRRETPDVASHVARAEEAVGYSFRDKQLLLQAITHASYCEESGTVEMYERLEFLGDSVLGFIVTTHIFEEFPDLPEGRLTELRAAVVSGDALGQLAADMGLADAVVLGHGAELTGGRRSTGILADVFEALVGAMYIDRGLEGTREFVLGALTPFVLPQAIAGRWHDYKSSLQEHTAATSGTMPEYRLVAREGPPHEPVFTVEVVVDGETAGEGRGRSKQAAEKKAAEEALARLGVTSGEGRPG